MQLNNKQEEAKNKIEWPLLIIAWAWSGKTATLTARVEYMIQEWIKPNEILMVTFTNKAAAEMRERVAKKLWIQTPKNLYKNYNFPFIWTFHSISIYVLKEMLSRYSSDELNIWLKKDFIIYDEQDKLSVLKWIIKNKLNLDEKEYPSKQIAFYISNAKNNLIGAKEYQNEVDSNLKEVVYKTYQEYEKTLQENNAIDFDDILLKTLKLLQNKNILDYYQEKFKYIMVDEYQDTNMIQYYIIKLLAWKYRNLAVVWDDSQSIYSFRGADMQNIIDFKKDYEDALIIKLEQNYRSTKKIISWANFVIANNNVWIKKELWTDNKEWQNIQYIIAPTEKLESEIVADIIKNKQEEGSKYSDNLILYRTNSQSRWIEEALINKQIPYRIVWGLKFYDRAEIKDLLAYLKILHNPNDVVAMKRIINKPTRKIGDKTISTIDNYRENFNLSYIQIIANIEEVDELNNWAKNAITNFYNLYQVLKEKSQKLDVSNLIKEIIKDINYIEFLTDWLTPEEKTSKLENIDELINLWTEYDWLEDSLSLFLEDISLITDMDLKDERNDYVTLMTIHSSKWLEQNRVFLVWVEEWLFPSVKSMWEQRFIEEERRLMYVAMTRAREELYISRAKERFYFWEWLRNSESRFIQEIKKDCIEEYDISVYIKKSTNIFDSFNFNKYSSPLPMGERLEVRSSKIEGGGFNNNREETTYKPRIQVQNNDVSSFSIWTKVSHPKFWNWIITELSSEIASIAFTWIWIKKMNIKIAPVKKI